MRGALTFTLLCVAVIITAAGLHALTSSPPCHEDEPCWNCETMGNRICGNLTPTDIPRTLRP